MTLLHQSGSEFVHVHTSNCDDYTGCKDDCRWLPRAQAEWDMGAWRERRDDVATRDVAHQIADLAGGTVVEHEHHYTITVPKEKK